MNNFTRRIKKRLLKKIDPLLEKAKKLTFPGFDGIPIYDVGNYFMKGLINGDVTMRASGVAFNLFLALFPAIIFIFTLIPYIPIENFQGELLALIEFVIPSKAYGSVQKTIEDIITRPHGGLLSVGFVMALFFSTNGIVSLSSAFNASVHVTDTRSWFAQQGIAILLVLILSLLLTISIVLITFTQFFLNFLVESKIIELNFNYYLINLGIWFIIVAIFFVAYSFLFFLAPASRSKWRFISAGGTLSTFLSIVLTLGFGFYIDNFGSYNALYGSIGTLPVVMLVIYFNCLAILIGFELNIGINEARKHNAIRKPKLLPSNPS